MTSKVVETEDTKTADDETVYEIEHVGLSGDYVTKITEEAGDPFLDAGAEFKKFEGVSPTVKRKISYEVQKALGVGIKDQLPVGNGMIGSGGAKSKQLQEFPYTGYDVFDVAIPPINLVYLAKLYELSPFNYAAVNAKTANVVGLGYTWVESPTMTAKLGTAANPDASRKKLEKLKITLDEWLDSLNQEALFQETLQRVYIDYQTTGNGYLEIGRTVRGDIGYIGHIPSTTMRVRMKRDGFVQIIGNRVVFFNNYGTTNQIKDPIGNDPKPNEVIHFKNYSPTTSFYGVPDVVSASAAVAGNEFASRFNLEYFENKAVPRYVVVLKGATLGRATERRLMEFFEVGLKGKSHRSLFIPLPPDKDNVKYDFKIEPVESKMQEGSFGNYREANRDEILMAHRVPITKIGIPGNVNLAAAQGADKTFKEEVAGPEQAIVQKKVNMVIKEKTDALILKLTEMTLTDENTQSTIDERSIQNQVETPNEQRARKGQPGLPGGDSVVKPPAPKPPATAAKKSAPAKKTATKRAKARANTAPDKNGTARNPKGAGRQAP